MAKNRPVAHRPPAPKRAPVHAPAVPVRHIAPPIRHVTPPMGRSHPHLAPPGSAAPAAAATSAAPSSGGGGGGGGGGGAPSQAQDDGDGYQDQGDSYDDSSQSSSYETDSYESDYAATDDPSSDEVGFGDESGFLSSIFGVTPKVTMNMVRQPQEVTLPPVTIVGKAPMTTQRKVEIGAAAVVGALGLGWLVKTYG